jgi:hypothetical protein
MISGIYTGDGNSDTEISVGFQPDVVMARSPEFGPRLVN